MALCQTGVVRFLFCLAFDLRGPLQVLCGTGASVLEDGVWYLLLGTRFQDYAQASVQIDPYTAWGRNPAINLTALQAGAHQFGGPIDDFRNPDFRTDHHLWTDLWNLTTNNDDYARNYFKGHNDAVLVASKTADPAGPYENLVEDNILLPFSMRLDIKRHPDGSLLILRQARTCMHTRVYTHANVMPTHVTGWSAVRISDLAQRERKYPRAIHTACGL